MKSVVVTGAAGFLGSHIALRHLERGDTVYGVDNFCSSSPTSDHLKELKTHERFIFIEADICDDPFRGWDSANGAIDLVYNFACPASPPIYQRMPVETMMTCTVGMKNVLDMAHDFDAIVVQASTSEVYGDPTTSPQKEEHWGNVHSYGPRACYDEGKRASEALCYDYRLRYGVDARLVRIFNTYGPNMDPNDGRVISNFICQALRGEKLTVYGNGEQSRSFCYVDDLIRGIMALGSLRENPGTPINVGNPHEFTVNELAHRVIDKVYGGSSNSLELQHMITRRPLPTDDPLQRRPDIALAQRFLDWSPQWSLNHGLDATVAYFRKRV